MIPAMNRRRADPAQATPACTPSLISPKYEWQDGELGERGGFPDQAVEMQRLRSLFVYHFSLQKESSRF